MQRIEAASRSSHFDLIQLADGVYAALGNLGGAAYSNAGIIDLGDEILIFDTFMTPQAGADLRRAAEELTGRPAGIVVISHAHSDHWLGNQAFVEAASVPIVATERTYDTMPDMVDWMVELRDDPAPLREEMEEFRQRLEAEVDPRRRESLALAIRRNGHLLNALDGLELCYPNVTFEGRLSFRGPGRHVELRAVEPAHTASDAYLVLPEDRIVFAGDLGFFQCQPFMGSCEPQAWIAQLERMEGMEAETFVPGHGPLGSRGDLSLQREYIALLEGRMADVIQAGGSVEEALAVELPAPFDAWLVGGMARWEANVRSSYERLAGKDN